MKIHNIVNLLFLFIAGLLFLFFFMLRPRHKRIESMLAKRSFNGVVKEKYIDYKDHAERKFKDAHNNIYYLPVAQRSILFDKIMIGDSIVKRKGELTGYVYRNDSLVLEIDYSTSIPK